MIFVTSQTGIGERNLCEKCPIGSYAARRPASIIARIWKWHTRWCPGWKAHQRALAEEQRESRPR